MTGRWEYIGANAHLLEFQELIREAIQRGMIRVVPAPNHGIRIIPMNSCEEQSSHPAPKETGKLRRSPVSGAKHR